MDEYDWIDSRILDEDECRAYFHRKWDEEKAEAKKKAGEEPASVVLCCDV